MQGASLPLPCPIPKRCFLLPLCREDPKEGGWLPSYWVFSEQGTAVLRSVWGFLPAEGEVHIISCLCFLLRTEALQMASWLTCLKLLQIPGGHKMAGACAERWGSKGGLALLGEVLAQFW